MKGFPDLPPLWLAGFCALAWVIAKALPLITLPGSVGLASGVALMLGGFGLVGWSAMWFLRKKTTIEPHHKPQSLIIEGPYRLSRNPIYLAMLMILVGWVFYLCALLPLVLPFIFARILTTRFVLPEEAALREAFGAEAEQYMDATRRWL